MLVRSCCGPLGVGGFVDCGGHGIEGGINSRIVA
jgi:hypothetical protein